MYGRENQRGSSWIWLAAVTIGSAFLHWAYYDQGVKNLIDLGVMAVDSQRIVEGQLFGRDFIAPYGPGRYYLIASLFERFGSSLNVLLSIFLVLRVAVDFCTFILARRLLPPLWALSITACVAFAHGPTHKGFLTLGIVLILLAMIQALEKPSKSSWFLLGVIAGLAGSFRYDLGALGVFLTIWAILLGPGSLMDKKRGRALGMVVLGLCLTSLPFLFLLFISDIQQLAVFELTRAEVLKSAQATVPAPWTALFTWTAPASGLLAMLLLLAPPLVLLGSLFFVHSRNTGHETADSRLGWGLIALSGCLLFSQYAIEVKINRLLQVGPPLFLCLFFLAHQLAARLLPLKARWILPSLLLALTGWYVVSESGRGSIDSPAVLCHPQEQVRTARGTFQAAPAMAQGLKSSLAWVDRNLKDSDFYASPALALHYFLAGKKNPTPVTDFTYLLHNEAMQHSVWNALQQERPDCYLYRPGIIQGFDPEKEAPLLFSNLKIMFPRYQALPSGYGVFLRGK